ncbi:hypothetical protein OSB04_011824 [Centaurea solstitialis]|uniref:Uncharacterized protein n=1 Tax=Centaurea solstitialis TaxID=347529 RepID=A0AA38WLV6_9ASTR|nr:hypothetical protein OSB04_011824 [Centaurea solstitialis]
MIKSAQRGLREREDYSFAPHELPKKTKDYAYPMRPNGESSNANGAGTSKKGHRKKKGSSARHKDMAFEFVETKTASTSTTTYRAPDGSHAFTYFMNDPQLNVAKRTKLWDTMNRIASRQFVIPRRADWNLLHTLGVDNRVKAILEKHALEENVKQEQYEKLKEVQSVFSSNLSKDGTTQQLPEHSLEILKSSKRYLMHMRERATEKSSFLQRKYWLKEVGGKKIHMLSAKVALYNSSNNKFFNRKLSTGSRFQEVIEVLRQQVFGIKCKIECQMLSLDTEYACFLVFKLSEKCRGLHCPVKVRDLIHRKNKEIGIIYFRFPRLCNLHDSNQVPRMREDGWMEVNVWKFNSNDGLKNDGLKISFIPINLKLISYEGTMAGLIICGHEIRPI